MDKVSIHQQFYVTLGVIKPEINKVGQLQNFLFHCTSKTSKMANKCKILPENSNIVHNNCLMEQKFDKFHAKPSVVLDEGQKRSFSICFFFLLFQCILHQSMFLVFFRVPGYPCSCTNKIKSMHVIKCM